MAKKERFIKIYSSLPLGVRKEVVLVIEEYGPITWDVAYLEIVSDTKLSKTILEKLEKLEII